MRRFAVSLAFLAFASSAVLRAEELSIPAGSTAPVAALTRKPEKIDTFKVHESLSSLWVDTRAPYPMEIENETQARALAKEAATALGQNALLRHVLAKKTAKGRALSEAQVPSTEIQDGVKALIAGAAVSGVKFDKGACRLRVSVDKKNLKVLLKKA